MTREERAMGYLREHGRPVDAAWAAFVVGEGSAEDVLTELSAYQNVDGGFGMAFEPDIAAPQSQPFGARLALHVLLSVRPPLESPLVVALERWLDETQDADGCWRLPDGLKEYPLAPWFAGWAFPSLNPALCLAGAAARLGIGSQQLQDRVRRLFDDLGSREEIAGGQFYSVLPYAEYVPWVSSPLQADYLDALVSEISRQAEAGGFDDAGHFFELVGPADGPVAQRMDGEIVAAQLDRLVAEQEADGGWPTPYAPHWRSWVTAGAIAVLRDYGRV